jgi:hypothetical protein
MCLFDRFNATFNNISVTSWQLVLLVEESGKIHDVRLFSNKTTEDKMSKC